jgi:hypothetical protein
MDIPEQITTTLTVKDLGAVNAVRGTQKIDLFIPEIGIKEYSVPMFIPTDVIAVKDLKPKDTFTATISRGTLRKDKDGQIKPGDWANEYYWDFVSLKDDTEAPTQPAATAEPAAAPQPTVSEEKMRIMLQHASGVVGPAYGDWCRLDTATRGTFFDYLKAIAMGATWYLKHVYVTTGYNPQPEPVEEVAEIEPNDPWDQAEDA